MVRLTKICLSAYTKKRHNTFRRTNFMSNWGSWWTCCTILCAWLCWLPRLKKVMCTYRNLGIFMSSASSPFRPQVNSLRISLWPYPADLTLARTNHVEEFKLKGFQLCKHKLVFTFKIPLSMTESISLM